MKWKSYELGWGGLMGLLLSSLEESPVPRVSRHVDTGSCLSCLPLLPSKSPLVLITNRPSRKLAREARKCGFQSLSPQITEQYREAWSQSWRTTDQSTPVWPATAKHNCIPYWRYYLTTVRILFCPIRCISSVLQMKTLSLLKVKHQVPSVPSPSQIVMNSSLGLIAILPESL